MALETLADLFYEELREVLSAERQLVKALPKMAKAASNEKLSAAFEEHLAQTEKQVDITHETLRWPLASATWSLARRY